LKSHSLQLLLTQIHVAFFLATRTDFSLSSARALSKLFEDNNASPIEKEYNLARVSHKWKVSELTLLASSSVDGSFSPLI
jgi:hypothetical protein